MRSQSHWFIGFWIELLDNFRPKQSSCPHFGNFHKMIHANSPKKRQARRKIVNAQTDCQTCLNVRYAVRQRVSEFDVRRAACLLNMVARNGNRVEFWHFCRRISENIRNYSHRRRGWIDVGVPHHELFENVILNRPRQFFGSNALFFGSDDVKSENRNHRAVHRHRNRHLVERNLVEQNFHVFYRINCHTRLADVARHPIMVGVVAAMRCQIKGNRQTFLTRRKVTPIKGIGRFGSRKTRILANRPRLRCVHRTIRST